MTEDTSNSWVAVARESYEYNLIPWVGRHAVPWLRSWTRPLPTDPTGQVLIPERIYESFKTERIPFQRITRPQLEAVGFPEPGPEARALPPGTPT
jgi:hypothetical protein